jgi:hypothetical protein
MAKAAYMQRRVMAVVLLVFVKRFRLFYLDDIFLKGFLQLDILLCDKHLDFLRSRSKKGKEG